MANPYGIEQVDVPGLLGAYQSAQSMRFQQMAAQRQMARQDQEDERRIKREGILSRVFSPQAKGGDPASSGTAPAQAGAAQAPMATAGPPGTLVDPAQLPPRTDGLQLNPDALRELYQVDPDTAKQVQDMVYTADKRQFEQMQRNGEAMATVAWKLKQLPAEARAAELQAWAPQLQQMGITPELLAKADLSDAGLDRYYTSGRKLSELVSENEPKYMAVPAGGAVVDVRNPEALQAFNSGGTVPPPPPGTVEGGYRFNGGDPADPKSWVPVGGPTPTASGNFPGDNR